MENTRNLKKIESLESYMYRKRYSVQTIKSYISILEKFFIYINVDSSRISNNDVNDYIDYLLFSKQLSGSYHNQFLNAYVLYCKINHPENRLKFNIRPKKGEYIPEVLSEQEVRDLLTSITNIKHKAIIAFIYSHGLRRSELINFKVSHFDKARQLIRVVQGKGKKDRNVPLNTDCRDILVKYFTAYGQPENYLFEGQGKPQYSPSSIAQILKRALKNIGITKRITIHSLRHSFATHLYDNEVPLDKIQLLMGHKRESTTRIYIKISENSVKYKYELKLAG